MVTKKQDFRDGCRAIFRLLKKNFRYGWQRLRFGKDERSPVLPDEFVLRRIHKNNFDPSLSPSVKRPAFEPNRKDDDGLSVHRELFISAEKLAWCGRDPGSYYIVRLSVKELASDQYGVVVIACSDMDQPPGHSVIPSLSAKDAKKTKPLQKKLANMADGLIIYKPANSSHSQ